MTEKKLAIIDKAKSINDQINELEAQKKDLYSQINKYMAKYNYDKVEGTSCKCLRVSKLKISYKENFPEKTRNLATNVLSVGDIIDLVPMDKLVNLLEEKELLSKKIIDANIIVEDNPYLKLVNVK